MPHGPTPSHKDFCRAKQYTEVLLCCSTARHGPQCRGAQCVAAAPAVLLAAHRPRLPRHAVPPPESPVGVAPHMPRPPHRTQPADAHPHTQTLISAFLQSICAIVYWPFLSSRYASARSPESPEPFNSTQSWCTTSCDDASQRSQSCFNGVHGRHLLKMFNDFSILLALSRLSCGQCFLLWGFGWFEEEENHIWSSNTVSGDKLTTISIRYKLS